MSTWSASPRPARCEAVLDIVPMSHLLFGTDYPFWAPDVTIKGLAGLKLSAADLQAIERDNALKLLPGLPRNPVELTSLPPPSRAAC